MPDFYSVILNLVSNSTAVMEVSSSGTGSVSFTVYSSTPGTAQIPFSRENYACSGSSSIPNLFTPSQGATALVKASSSVGLGAFLRQWSGSQDLGYAVPPSTKTFGTSFRFPVGSNATSTKLLIGNPNSSNVTASVYYGRSTTPALSQSIGPNGVAQISVTQLDKAVKVTSTGSVVVLRAVEMGSGHDVSFVLPS